MSISAVLISVAIASIAILTIYWLYAITKMKDRVLARRCAIIAVVSLILSASATSMVACNKPDPPSDPPGHRTYMDQVTEDIW